MLRAVLVERLFGVVGIFQKDPSFTGCVFFDETYRGAGSRGFEVRDMSIGPTGPSAAR